MERYTGSIYYNKPIILPSEILEKANSGYMPQITSENLRWRYHKVKPVVTYFYLSEDGLRQEKMILLKGMHEKDLHMYYISAVLGDGICKYNDIISYTSIPQPEQMIERSHNPEYISDFLCLHKFRSKDFFGTSIASILAQIPKEILNEANAFQVSEYPKALRHVDMYPELTEKGYHLSRVKAYLYHRNINK